MKDYKRLVIICVFMTLFTFVPFGNDDLGAQEKVISIRLGHITAVGDIIDLYCKKFAELVSAKSNGRVKVTIYPAQQLGTATEILEGVSMGSIDMYLDYEGFMEMFDKDYSIFSTPFLTTNEDVKRIPYLMEIRERVRKRNNIRTLAAWGFKPPFHLWTQKRIVKTPDDLKGIKIRLWQQKVHIDSWNFLGASAIPIPWAEAYLALSQGLVNSITHNTVQIVDSKMHEVVDYCTLLDVNVNNVLPYINDKRYNSFPADIQKAFNEAAWESGEYFTKLCQSLEQEKMEIAKKRGVKFIQGDRAAWVKKAKDLHVKLENEGAWPKGLLAKIGKR